MNPFCTIITPEITALAEKINEPVKRIQNAINILQTNKQSVEMPTEDEIKKLIGKSPYFESRMSITQNTELSKLYMEYTPKQQIDRASLIASEFSAIVSEKLEDKLGALQEALKEAIKSNNISDIENIQNDINILNTTKGRQLIIQEVTANNIFEEIKNSFIKKANTPLEKLNTIYKNGEYIKNEYIKLVDNFETLLDFACNEIETKEYLRLIPEKHLFFDGNNSKITTGAITIKVSEETEQADEEFGDNEDGNKSSGNESFSFKVRFTDPYTTMSKEVKNIVSHIVKLNENGQFDVDDLGKLRYYNPEYIHTVLLQIMSEISSPEEFNIKNEDGTYSFPVLENAQTKYAWLDQVINLLYDNENLLGKFYADLRKDLISYTGQYSYIDSDLKSYTITKNLNEASIEKSVLSQIVTNYEQGFILSEESIYKQDGTINKENAKKSLKYIEDIFDYFDTVYFNSSEGTVFGEDQYETMINTIVKIFKIFGIDTHNITITNMLTIKNGFFDIKSILKEFSSIAKKVQKLDPNIHLISQFSLEYKKIAKNYGIVDEFYRIMTSFREGDKLRYSFSAPNYLDTMVKHLRDNNEIRRNDYINKEFKQYKWFFKNGKWRNEWLKLIEEDSSIRNTLGTRELLTINEREYKDWTAQDIKMGFIREFFSLPVDEKNKYQYGYYNLPIFSDSPIAKFIKGVRYTGDYKSQLIPLFRNVVLQELDRIQWVQARKQKNAATISNYDKNGLKFNFFPELNSVANFTNTCLKYIENKDSDALNKLIDSNIEIILNNLFTDFLDNLKLSDSQIETFKKDLIQYTADNSENFNLNEKLEEYFWNQAFATTQIIQLTTTDLAFYKDDVDFQKRFKEVYAAGTKLNTETKYGKKTRKTIIISDSVITSSKLLDIEKSLSKAIERGYITELDKDTIISKFKEINVADAQCYISPEAFRSMMDMLGVWTDEMEMSYNRFRENQWDMNDFFTIFQTIKPFLYGQISVPDGLGNNMKLPTQYKNSEYILMAAYSLISNSIGDSPKLRALQKFMTKNNIDAVQFESGVKVGGQGIIDINYSQDKLNRYKEQNKAQYKRVIDAAKENMGNKFENASDFEKFKEGNDYLLINKKITQEEYNERFEQIEPSEAEVEQILYDKAFPNGEENHNVVHEIPYEYFCIAQPTPEHLLDNESIFGSQLRNLIIADLPEDFRITIHGIEMDRKKLTDLYKACIVENLIESYSKISKEVQNINSLQKILLNQIKSNSKYSRDLINALQIVTITNPITGEQSRVFNMPLNNPNITMSLQELVTSLFKNNITKQYINGGNAILVSNYGLTDKLQLEYDSDGKLIGIPCYLPASSKEFFKKFIVKKEKDGVEYGELDIQKLKEANLDKLIGYRIPTEDKYSMAPLIIKGFLPQQSGSCIMLPADITTIAGSDFDIDKMFLMIPSYTYEKEERYNQKKAKNDYSKLDTENIEPFNEWFSKNKNKYKYTVSKLVKNDYDFNKTIQENSKAQRDNLLIDIIYGILTHPDSSDKIMNPGNFDKIKLQARMTEIITNKNILDEFKTIYNLKTEDEVINKILSISKNNELKELDSFLKTYKNKFNQVKSQLTINTFVYNHTQNMVGGKLIGMYANNTTMQAKFQYSQLALKDNFVFNINGRNIKSLHSQYSELNERILSNCAQASAASVDNVKDPVLASLLQNTKTANITAFMLRAGMSWEEISLLFAQPIIRKCYFDNDGTLDNLYSYIKEYINEFENLYSEKIDNRSFRLHSLTSEDLLKNIINNTVQKKVSSDIEIVQQKTIMRNSIYAAQLMEHIMKLSADLAELTQICRADSPNGAILNSIAGAKVQLLSVQKINYKATNNKFYPFEGVQECLQANYISDYNNIEFVRKKLNESPLSILQSFYSLGIEGGLVSLRNFFPQLNTYTDSMLSYIINNCNPNFLKFKKSAVKAINTFYKEFTEFSLTQSSLFGDDEVYTYEEKRKYYLTEFPEKFKKIKITHPELLELGLMHKLDVNNGAIILNGISSMKQASKDFLIRDMESLLYMDDTARQLAFDLFMYSFYKDGFSFGPNSFGNLFSTQFMNSFPEFISTLRDMGNTINYSLYLNRFLPQFYANNAVKQGLVNSFHFDNSNMSIKDNNLWISNTLVFNQNTYSGQYDYIIIERESNFELYKFYNRADKQSHYVQVPIFMEQKMYNVNKSVEEMKEFDIPYVNNTKNSESSKKDEESLFKMLELNNAVNSIDMDIWDDIFFDDQSNNDIYNESLDNITSMSDGLMNIDNNTLNALDDYISNMESSPELYNFDSLISIIEDNPNNNKQINLAPPIDISTETGKNIQQIMTDKYNESGGEEFLGEKMCKTE